MTITSHRPDQAYSAKGSWIATAVGLGALCTSASLYSSEKVTVSESGGVGVDQTSPVFVETTSGGLIGFEDYRSGMSQYRTQVLNSYGQSVGSSFPFAETYAPNNDMADLSFSSNSVGDIVAIWRHSNTNERKLLRIDPVSGLAIGNPVQILADEEIVANGFDSTVHVSEDGTVLVLFDSHPYLRGQLYNAYFSPLSSSFPIGDEFDPGPMNAAFHPDGAFTIAWTGTSLTYFHGARSQVFNSNGVARNSVLDHTDAELFMSNPPVVTVGSNGESLVAWSAYDSGNSSSCQVVTATGTAIGEPSVIVDSSEFVSDVNAVHAKSDGTWIVASYESSRRATVLKLNSYLQAMPGELAFDGDGHASMWMSDSESLLLGWHTESSLVQTDIEGVVISSDEMTASASQQLTDDVDGADQVRPALASNAQGQSVIAWEDGRYGTAQIFRQVFDETGSPVGPNQHVAGSGQRVVEPDCAMNASGQSIVTWQELVDGEWVIFAQRYNMYGAELGAPINTTANSTEPEIEYEVGLFDDGSFIVSYQTLAYNPGQGDYEEDLYVRRFGPDGVSETYNAQKVNGSHSARLDHEPVAFALHSDGSCFLIYGVVEDGYWDRSFRVKDIAATGQPTGSERVLASSMDLAFTGAAGDDDGFSIAWVNVWSDTVHVRHYSNDFTLLASDTVYGQFGDPVDGRISLSSDGRRVLTYNDQYWNGSTDEDNYRYQIYDSSGVLLEQADVFENFGESLRFLDGVEFGVAGDRLIGGYSATSMTDQGYDIMLTSVGIEVCAQPDYNCDGLINGADLSWLLGHWGLPTADITGDGLTDGSDLAVLLGHWTDN